MKTGFLFNCTQEFFSHGYGVITGDKPYPLRSVLRSEYENPDPKRILDVGCGSGGYELPNHNYLEIDQKAKP